MPYSGTILNNVGANDPMRNDVDQRRNEWRESFRHARSVASTGSHGYTDPSCVFCQRLSPVRWGDAPKPEPETPVIEEWDDHVAFRPLKPVSPLHALVVPRAHVPNHTYGLALAETMMRAAELARSYEHAGYDTNLISSSGAAATQTVNHLHVHVVERTTGDGLQLPWTHPDERKTRIS